MDSLGLRPYALHRHNSLGWSSDCLLETRIDKRPAHQRLPMPPKPPSTRATPKAADTLVDVLTVDVEDYYHVEAFADRISAHTWPDYPSRVGENTRRILRIFEEHACRVLSFVGGELPGGNPALPRKIVPAGHEVPCHSYAHRRVNSLT